MAVSGDWMSLKEMMQGQSPADETHVACVCRPAITYCGRFSAEATAQATTFDAEPHWCTDCMYVFESSGCGLCGCRFGALCQPCEDL